MRTPGTNPESAKIASRPLPLPLLRSLSFLLFFFLNLFPLPSANTPYPHPPTPGCGRSRPEAGEGGEVGAEVAGGEGRWRQRSSNKQTHQPQGLLCPLRWARSCAGGCAGQEPETRPRRAAGLGGDAAGVRAPSLGLASDALSRSGPKFLSREAAEWISFSYLFIYLFPRSRSPPSLSSPTLLHAFFLRPHSLLP